jgi:hypothetical protein
MFRIGPVPGKPIPSGSFIMCCHCEEILGRTKEEIRIIHHWTSTAHIDYINPPKWIEMCPFCGQHFIKPSRQSYYFPTDNFMGKIVLFLAEKLIG